MFKKVLLAVWTFSLEKGYNWILSKTTLDEKAIEVIDEIEVRSANVKKEFKDVVNAAKGLPTKPKKKYYKPKPKADLKK
jgi:hypothetical protein